MLKKVLIVLFSIVLLNGCSHKIDQNDGKDRIYLDEKYYNKGDFIELNQNNLDLLDNGSYIIFTHNSYCSMGKSCESIFKSFMEKYKIDFYKIPFEYFKETIYYEKVKYAPSIIIVKDGNVLTYLDANSDDDYNKYQDVNIFTGWLNNYIYFKKLKS